MAAVKLLKVLEAENRGATPAEKIVLAQYTGWGHTPQAFVYYAERTRLGQLLSDNEADRIPVIKEKWESEQSELQEHTSPRAFIRPF